MIVLDASVIIDAIIKPQQKKADKLLEKQLKRHRKTKTLMELLITSKIPIYIPRIALIEVAALTKRKIGLVSSEILEFISQHFNILKEDSIWDIAMETAKETGCRTVDSYYIATAKKTNSTLITADKIMAENAKTSILPLS